MAEWRVFDRATLSVQRRYSSVEDIVKTLHPMPERLDHFRSDDAGGDNV